MSAQPLIVNCRLLTKASMSPEDSEFPAEKVQQTRLWRDQGWTATVIKNEDDDGWAVAMTASGQAEPALIGPWTMGRDKKNPKPLDSAAFNTLVKTAREFVRRQEQQQHAALHPSIDITVASGSFTVRLDIQPDDDHPSAQLSATDEAGTLLARVSVSPGFRLTRARAMAWAEASFNAETVSSPT